MDACVSRLIFATACFATVMAVAGGIVCALAGIGTAVAVSAAAPRIAAPRFQEKVIAYFLNLKFARWGCPSLNFTISCRQEFAQLFSVFQTYVYWSLPAA